MEYGRVAVGVEVRRWGQKIIVAAWAFPGLRGQISLCAEEISSNQNSPQDTGQPALVLLHHHMGI